MSVTRTIARNTLYGFVEIGVDFIISFILGIVLARQLGAEQYGIYAYLTWLFGLVTMLADLGLSEMSKRFIAEAIGRGDTRQAAGIVRLTLVLRFGAAIFIGLLSVLVYNFLPSLSGHIDSRIFFVIIAVTVLPHGLNYAFISIFRGFQKYEHAAYITTVTAPIRLVLVVVLLFTGSGVRDVLLVQLGTYCFGAIIGLLLLRRIMPLKALLWPSLLDKAMRNKAIKYAFTLAGISIVNYVAYNQLAYFFLELYAPVDQVGFCRLAGRMAQMPMAIIPMAFSFVLTPAIAEQFGKGDTGKIRAIYLTSIRFLMMVAIPLEIGMIALANPIIMLLYGPEYAPAIILMQIALIPAAVGSISNAASAVMFGTNRPSFMFFINFLYSFVSIGLILWLVPRYGAIGAAMVNIVPVTSILVIWFVNRQIGVTFPWKDTLKISTASILMGAAAFGVQSQLGPGPSLAIGVPMSVTLYVVLIFLMRIPHRDDLAIFKNVQKSLPKGLRKYYRRPAGIVEKIILSKKYATK